MSDRLFEDDVVFSQRFLRSAGFYRSTIDGQWGSKTDAAASAFETAAAVIADELGRFDPSPYRGRREP
jgi:peptidoglycan L-alanyl-D-glutamate endopeptidase CwlK